jgi:hypothetical protein
VPTLGRRETIDNSQEEQFMRIHRIFAALLVALTLSALGSITPQPAAAAGAAQTPITITFTATVIELNDWAHALGNIQLGDTVTGTYTYNAAAVNLSQTPGTASYLHTTGSYGMRANIGGTVVETDPQNLYFYVFLANNWYERDIYSVVSANNRPLSGLYNVTSLAFGFYDNSQTALKNVKLPKTAPTLSDWQQSDETWGFHVKGQAIDPNSEYEFYLRARVTSVQKM